MTKHSRRQLDLFQRSVTPLPERDRTHGLVVLPPQPCRCGCELAVIGEGKGPHIASLFCVECGVHRGWVSHAVHKFITEIIDRIRSAVRADSTSAWR